MAAIATAKPGAQTAVQLTFPAVYQSVYASQHRPLQYVPSAVGPLVRPLAGDDFQSHYHAQKKRDADYMARAKVQSTRLAERRMLLSHQNYFGMPSPQLAQRHFANPSNGSLVLSSSRRDGTEAPFQLVESALVGGVLRTAEGQAYGKARLVARVKQLDRIAAEKLAFEGVAPPTPEGVLAPSVGAETLPTAPSAPVTSNARIELQLLLKSIIDALMGDIAREPNERDELSRFTFSDSVRALSLIVRVASSPDTRAEYLEDVLAPVDNINSLLEGLTDPDRREQVELSEGGKERLITTAELFKRIGEYLRGMMGGIDRSPKERLALSKNLVRSLGFTQFARDMERQRVENKGFYERVSRSRIFDTRGRQEFDDEDDDDADDRFTRPSESREDSESYGNQLSEFTADERQRFGYESGAFYGAPRQNGRERPSFYGEEEGALSESKTEGEDLGYSSAAAISSQPLRVQRRVSPPSSEIRGVYDPVLGSRGIEVVRRPIQFTGFQAAIPTRQSELPSTREGFAQLAEQINRQGGIDGKMIKVYKAGKLENIRRNFIRRLGLVGKY